MWAWVRLPVYNGNVVDIILKPEACFDIVTVIWPFNGATVVPSPYGLDLSLGNRIITLAEHSSGLLSSDCHPFSCHVRSYRIRFSERPEALWFKCQT